MACPRLRSFMLLCLVGSALVAQGVVTLQGQVRGTDGKPIPGATLQLEGPAPGKPFLLKSDATGRYQYPGLAPGRYTLFVRHPHFFTMKRTITVLQPGTIDTDVVMHVYELPGSSATVVVEGTSAFVHLRDLDEPVNYLLGVADTASQGVVTPAQLQSRAYQRPADVLESVPGLLVSQHSGEGKANQYYLRGFNLDHGTDLAVSVAGIPANMPTNGHGQGYLDLNFLIPELTSRAQYKKGPYFADEGDFAAAGAVNIDYVHKLERSLFQATAGSYGFERLLGAASQPLGGGELLAAVELGRNNGPWDVPEDFRKYNGVLRYSWSGPETQASLTAMSYWASWAATNHIPQRAVDSGLITRFGNMDPSDAGTTGRSSLAFEWNRKRAGVEDRLEAFVVGYRMSLGNNFTYFLDDPVHGDQFEQADHRFIGGLKASRIWSTRWADKDLEFTLGFQGRSDHITPVSLTHTEKGVLLETIREDRVLQTSLSPYGQAKVQWSDQLRSTLGLRYDDYRFRVDSNNPLNSGRSSSRLWSPKLGLALGPFGDTEFYANWGRGFHSNDARGTTLHVDPKNGEPASPVTPLVPATGYEVGVRSTSVPRWETAFTLWRLDLESELLFLGDAGITEPSRPSRRQGFEWTNQVRLASWVTLQADLGYSQARFRDFDPVGDRIPGAVEGVAIAGLTIRPADGWEAQIQYRHFGARPLVEDNSVRSKASNLLNAKLRFEASQRLHMTLELFNLTNSKASDIDYYYQSRLQDEPLQGASGIHNHPMEPLSGRLSLTWNF